MLLRDPWTGVYQQRLACLAGEGPGHGCGADGLIDVRDESGTHFSAIHNVGPCPVYSSGVVRFAAPIADAVAARAGAGAAAPLPGPPAAVDAQTTVRALLGSSAVPTTIPRFAVVSPVDREIADQSLLSGDAGPDFAALPPPSDTGAPAPTLEDPASSRESAAALGPLGRSARAEASFTAPGPIATIDQVVHVARTERAHATRVRGVHGTGATTCLERAFGAPVRDRRAATTGVEMVDLVPRNGGRDFVLEYVLAGRTVMAIAVRRTRPRRRPRMPSRPSPWPRSPANSQLIAAPYR